MSELVTQFKRLPKTKQLRLIAQLEQRQAEKIAEFTRLFQQGNQRKGGRR